MASVIVIVTIECRGRVMPVHKAICLCQPHTLEVSSRHISPSKTSSSLSCIASGILFILMICSHRFISRAVNRHLSNSLLSASRSSFSPISTSSCRRSPQGPSKSARILCLVASPSGHSAIVVNHRQLESRIAFTHWGLRCRTIGHRLARSASSQLDSKNHAALVEWPTTQSLSI